MAGEYVALEVARLASYFLGKVVPTTDTFVAIMIEAFRVVITAGFDNVEDSLSQIAGIGGCAHLVEDDVELWLSGCEVEHSLDKILAIFAVEPSCAEDDIIAPRREGGLFAKEFGAAISTCGVDGFVFGAWGVVGVAPKNIIGGHMNKSSARRIGGFGQISHSLSINQLGCGFILFGTVDIGIGGTVDDHINGVVAEKGPHCGLVGNIQFIDVSINIMIRGSVTEETDMGT